MSITDIAVAVSFYLLGALGITHRAFNANRALRIGLAIAGSMAFQLGDTRRDRVRQPGDPAPRPRLTPGTASAVLRRLVSYIR